ncbi:MAG: hypothetical protein KBT04_04030 [Bacteroidales bacterium]|nr:hypothetical protein [Candidatus Colimorpha onthohippi]
MPQATSPTSKGKKKKKKATGAASKRPILTGATGNLDQSIQMCNSDGEKTYAQLLWRAQLLAGTYIFAAYSSVSLSPIIRSM